MINIRTLKKITNNGGLTLKNGKPITYKSGWQVATEGMETTDMKEAMKMIRYFRITDPLLAYDIFLCETSQ